jgi:acyl dehydratase
MRYFEDLEVGYKNRGGSYKVSKEEIIRFASEYDPQPFHLDEAAANASVFGGLIACGAHTVALHIKLIHLRDGGRSEGAVLAGLGWDEVRFAKPVRPDDVLTSEGEVIESRPSESKPDRGIVRIRQTVLNQHEETVFTATHTILVAKRPTTS